jgi:SNF family Na+-dependent transporter
MPILYLEATLGQMHQESIPFIFSRINKGLKFVGVTYVFINYHFASYYNVILAYSYRFVFSVFDPSIHF